MNMSVLEEWVGQMGLPRGVQSHLAPVRDLLNWLQVAIFMSDISYMDSSMIDFLLGSLFHHRFLESGRYHSDFQEHQPSPGKFNHFKIYRTARIALIDATCCPRLQIRNQRG